MSVHREGENPSSMDGVPDLRDHNSIDYMTEIRYDTVKEILIFS